LTSFESVVAGHERWLASLDPLLPATHPLPDPEPVAAVQRLSGPFWHRSGYRPLWTVWKASPAARLGITP
jgi:hypothetical protein